MADERLWAPWRLEYIKGPKPDGCIFCDKPAEGDDEATYVVHRGERCFVILNAFPYNNGHVMIAPYEHTGALEELADETVLELMQLTQRSIRRSREVYGAGGLQHRRSTRARSRAPASRTTSTSTSSRAGAPTPTSCR